MPQITVFTPTYNRGNLLRCVYESLQKQTYKDFEWVIVDDGSTDETERIVTELKNEAMFPITYKKKKNEGKHIAINEGCRLARGEWFFIVDSDDYLMPEAIEHVLYYCNQVNEKPEFAGVVGLRGNSKGEAWTGWYQKQGQDTFLKERYIDATALEYRYKHKIQGDRAEVVRTEIIKQHPFPKFGGEKFLVESFLWFSLAKEGYKFRWFNEVIYITEYLEDGLTQNIIQHYYKNPVGSMTVANLKLSCSGVPWKEKIRSCYQYYKYGLYAGINIISLIKRCESKVFSLFGLPLALIYKK